MSLPQHAALWKDMAPHWRTLKKLAKGHKSILELGVRGAVSTWALLEALPPDGLLTSIDIQEVAEIPAEVRHDRRWQFWIWDDRNPFLRDRLPPATFAFIDTSHEYHHTLQELDLAAFVGAQTIVLHDYALPDVFDAVAGFCARNPWRIAGVEQSQWGMVWLTRQS